MNGAAMKNQSVLNWSKEKPGIFKTQGTQYNTPPLSKAPEWKLQIIR